MSYLLALEMIFPFSKKIIDTTLGSLVGIYYVAYLDDILVFSPDTTTHTNELNKVLSLLSKAGLHLKNSKCEL